MKNSFTNDEKDLTLSMTVTLLSNESLPKTAIFVGAGAIRRARRAIKTSRNLVGVNKTVAGRKAQSQAKAQIGKSSEELLGLNKEMAGMDPTGFVKKFKHTRRTSQTQKLLKKMDSTAGTMKPPGKIKKPSVNTPGVNSAGKKKEKTYFTKKQFRRGAILGGGALFGAGVLTGQVGNKSQQKYNKYYQ